MTDLPSPRIGGVRMPRQPTRWAWLQGDHVAIECRCGKYGESEEKLQGGAEWGSMVVAICECGVTHIISIAQLHPSIILAQEILGSYDYDD